MNKLFINGQFVESKSTEDLDVINPATEEVIDTVTLANEDDAEKAIKGANAAQLEWEKVNIIKRAKIVEALAEKLEKNKDELAKIYVEEQGKIYSSAIGEIDKSIEYIKYMCSLARKNNGEVLQSEVENETVILTKKPVGTTVGIIPWNAPIFVLMRKLIPALVTGCSIVVKPSEETPFGTFKIAEYIQETDIPDGLVQILTGTGSDVGNYLSQSKNVDFISITGSIGAGKSVMENAASNVKV